MSLPRPTPVRTIGPSASSELDGSAGPARSRLSAFSAARPLPVQAGGLTDPIFESVPGLTTTPSAGRRRPASASEGMLGCEVAAIEGWLAGLGLERYAELLLQAGWDTVEVTYV